MTQTAYAAAGIRLPRVAQDQYNAGPVFPTNPSAGEPNLVLDCRTSHSPRARTQAPRPSIWYAVDATCS
ncbi:hypothetical protein [Streptomyces humicola]|uniref:hypothetical protein n=1 Tax=Streptomyces humicola TaxID=2953240 RepID=UPI0022B27710|nr:hypothetical protein [Streptomyces humicola]